MDIKSPSGSIIPGNANIGKSTQPAISHEPNISEIVEISGAKDTPLIDFASVLSQALQTASFNDITTEAEKYAKNPKIKENLKTLGERFKGLDIEEFFKGLSPSTCREIYAATFKGALSVINKARS